ncbi:MAG TPA: hypothetical protein ENK10_03845 [Acidobacteria bacterium]|nr:hypothetical protein [Acidobacteriota bacterium]
MNRSKLTTILILGLAFGGFAALGATPPEAVNYQGVLRDAADKPLDGDYEMEFRFWNRKVGGDEILIDQHLAANGQAVTASGGLFSVELGTGQVLDGSGPGTYTSLSQVFADYGNVWLEVQVGAETLSPRIRIVSAAYSLNAGRLAGRPAGEFLDTSATSQTKSGELVVNAAGQGTYGVEVYGDTAGAYIKDADGSGYAIVGDGDRGINAYGTNAGGYFEDTDESGYALVGRGHIGIYAAGNERGAWFDNRLTPSFARLADGDYGVLAEGAFVGGYFRDIDNSGRVLAGFGDRGIEASGNEMGGYFEDIDESAYAKVAEGDTGVSGYGNFVGGYFKDLDDGSHAYLGYGGRGILAMGYFEGGYFADGDDSGRAYLATGDYGLKAFGNEMGGYFKDNNQTGNARVGYGDSGIKAYGDLMGGYFEDTDQSGYAFVGHQDYGILGRGNVAGGSFRDLDSGTYMDAARGGSTTSGNGAKNFVQNHPYDPSRKIVYTSLEGNEAGTYTRGSGRLSNGVAVIPLDETFGWVTNPDIGLTAHVTARGTLEALAVESVSTSELTIIGEPGSDAPFDYVVYGLRIGFEEIPVVQPRGEGENAPIPSMAAHRALLAEQPELKATTPLERFREMAAQVQGVDASALDLSRARSLVAAIHEFDPAVDGIEPPELAPRLEDAELPPAPQSTSPGSEAAGGDDPTAGGPDATLQLAAGSAALPAERGETSSAEALELPPGVVTMAVSTAVEPGDLLALDPELPGVLRAAASAADPGVVGVAAAPAREGDSGHLEVPVLAAGIVELKADAGYGAIRPGDLLVSSPTPGHGMRMLEQLPGTVIGKALEPLEGGMGTIRVLLMAR